MRKIKISFLCLSALFLFACQKKDQEIKLHFQPLPGQGIVLLKDKGPDQDYALYSYEGDVHIEIEGEKMPLKEALDKGKITMDQVLEEARGDFDQEELVGYAYSDGGTQAFPYKDYSIIKFHTLEGKRDAYIGPENMDIHELGVE